jgi:hypothetical protein
MSSFGKEISLVQRRLMQKTNEIRKSAESNKSLIQGLNERRKQKEEDKMIAV